MNWNVTVEYQISANNLFKAVLSGIGRRAPGGKLEHQRLPDQFRRRQSDPASRRPSPTRRPICRIRSSAAINHMANTGHSSYHAGTVQYSKRYSGGLVLDSFYTYSKALDDCDTDYGTCTGVAPISDRNLN